MLKVKISEEAKKGFGAMVSKHPLSDPAKMYRKIGFKWRYLQWNILPYRVISLWDIEFEVYINSEN